MSLLYNLIEFTYNPKTRMYFFLSPFALMILGWVLIFIEIYILRVDAQQAALYTFFPVILYFVAWVLYMILIRIKYYPQGGELKKIEYIPAKVAANILVNEAKKSGFGVEVGKNTNLKYANAKIKGAVDGVSFLIERSRDPQSRGAGLNSFVTGIYINTQKKDNFAINQDDLDSRLDLIVNPIKKRIILNYKQDLLWLLKEKGFISVIDFRNGSMGAAVGNDMAMAPYLKQTLEIIVEVVKEYEKD